MEQEDESRKFIFCFSFLQMDVKEFTFLSRLLELRPFHFFENALHFILGSGFSPLTMI
jgi:hypothetical protein